MSRRKVDKKSDEITRYLLSQGVYSLKNSGDAADKNLLKLLKTNEKKVYRLWLGVFYGIILLLSLYWLPLFGPMIAGYIAGRRAGSPLKGSIAAAIIIVVFYVIQSPEVLGNIPINLQATKDSIRTAAVSHLPWLSPAISFVVSYTTPAVSILSGQISYTPQTYTILLVFAYIGGTIASQKREEIKLMAMGRILSRIPVQPVLEPVPHHSASSSTVRVLSFDDLEKADFGFGDTEIQRIYEEEYAPKKSFRKKRKGKKLRKEEIARRLVEDKANNRIEVL